jgi:hypothetical protein
MKNIFTLKKEFLAEMPQALKNAINESELVEIYLNDLIADKF